MSLGRRDPPHIEGGTCTVTLFRGFRRTDARIGKELSKIDEVWLVRTCIEGLVQLEYRLYSSDK
jgi:hypothetical protein